MPGNSSQQSSLSRTFDGFAASRVTSGGEVTPPLESGIEITTEGDDPITTETDDPIITE